MKIWNNMDGVGLKRKEEKSDGGRVVQGARFTLCLKAEGQVHYLVGVSLCEGDLELCVQQISAHEERACYGGWVNRVLKSILVIFQSQ